MNKVQRMLAGMVAKATGLSDLFLTGQEMPWQSGGGSAPGVNNAYSNSAIAYACMRKKARDASRVPLKFLRVADDPDSALDQNVDHPTKRLLQRPHPQADTTTFFEWLVTYMELRGEVFVVPDNPVMPTTLVPWYDPMRWRAETDHGNLVKWTLNPGAGAAGAYGGFSRMDVDLMHARYIKPGDPYRGQSPLQAAMFAHQIDTVGDQAQADLFKRGGERGSVFYTDKDLNDHQRKQNLQVIRARHTGNGQAPRDILLSSGAKPADARMTNKELDWLGSQSKAKEKICAVYGVTPALIFEDDSPNFATFHTRRRIYWDETLVPLLGLLESMFDSYFAYGPAATGGRSIFVRFDLSNVVALQDQMGEKLDNADKLMKLRVPLTVANERLQLGLDTDQIEGADTVLVQGSLAPLPLVLQDYQVDIGGSAGKTATPANAAGNTAPPAAPMSTTLTQEVVRQRAMNVRNLAARERRLEKLRRRMASKWRGAMNGWKKKTVAAVPASAANVDDVMKALKKLVDPMAEDLISVADPHWNRAAIEGVASIEELTGPDGKADVDLIAKAPLGKDTLAALKQRKNLVKNMPNELFGRIREDLVQLMQDSDVISADEWRQQTRAAIKGEFNISINRSATIARTEIGTMYNVSRYHEMDRAGYDHHEWLTAADEMVRGEEADDDFDHTVCNGKSRKMGNPFPNGLLYPNDPEGEPGNVINCRCMTIPVVK